MKSDFYQGHLDRVSRSFAFCIARLNEPFRERVGLAYLLCRIVDTIEDSRWDSSVAQFEQFDHFSRFLSGPPRADEVRAWVSRFPEAIPEGERLLLSDAPVLFDDLHALPAESREAIQATACEMAQGMRAYVDRSRAQAGNALRLTDLQDVDRYCYFVAGIVGEMLTRLYQACRPEFAPTAEDFRNSCRFGLFLQKVNLLKDQRTDEREGRFLIPDRGAVLDSLRAEAMGALEYICALPSDERPFRVFCAWSLFLGLASLPYIQESFVRDDGTKIPREATREVIEQIEAVVQDNAVLRTLFEANFPALPECVPSGTTGR